MKRLGLGVLAAGLLAGAALSQTARYISPSAAVASSYELCNGQCNVVGFQVNTGASAGWVMLFDATSVPADGAVAPIKWYQVAANSTIGVSWEKSLHVMNGATIVFSTTGPFTKTASATATFSGEVQ